METSFKTNFKLSFTGLFLIGIAIQIIASQGLLTYTVFNYFGFWQLKTYLHSIGVIVTISSFLLLGLKESKVKLQLISLLLFAYLLLHYLISFNKFDSFVSVFYSLREIVLLFILLEAYSFAAIEKRFLDKISALLLVLVAINIFFVGLNFLWGHQKYMLYMTGRYIWPLDPILKFKIGLFLGEIPRSPGLVGESASLGLFGALSFFVIKNSKYKNLAWIALILAFMSLTRSVYIIVIIYFALRMLSNKKYLLISIASLPILIAASVYLFYKKIFNLESFYMRIDNWFYNIGLESNFLFGGNLSGIGKAISGDSFASVMDSYWILLYHGVGVLGLLLVVIFLFSKVAISKRSSLMLIAIISAGFFITLSQSITFLVIFPLFSIKSWFSDEY